MKITLILTRTLSLPLIFQYNTNMLKKLLHYWKKFAFALGYINTRIILTLLFFIILGIYALILKPGNWYKNFFSRSKDSYWQDKSFQTLNLDFVRNQF